jgi:hypothetical protein
VVARPWPSRCRPSRTSWSSVAHQVTDHGLVEQSPHNWVQAFAGGAMSTVSPPVDPRCGGTSAESTSRAASGDSGPGTPIRTACGGRTPDSPSVFDGPGRPVNMSVRGIARAGPAGFDGASWLCPHCVSVRARPVSVAATLVVTCADSADLDRGRRAVGANVEHPVVVIGRRLGSPPRRDPGPARRRTRGGRSPFRPTPHIGQAAFSGPAVRTRLRFVASHGGLMLVGTSGRPLPPRTLVTATIELALSTVD